jgi:hypothetical protein
MGSGHGVDPSFLFISGASLPAVPGRANSNFGLKTLEVGIEPILMATETTQNSENTKIQRLTISLFLATPGLGREQARTITGNGCFSVFFRGRF